MVIEKPTRVGRTSTASRRDERSRSYSTLLALSQTGHAKRQMRAQAVRSKPLLHGGFSIPTAPCTKRGAVLRRGNPMPQLHICSCGHQWETAGDAAALDSASPFACPACGAGATVLSEGGRAAAADELPPLPRLINRRSI